MQAMMTEQTPPIKPANPAKPNGKRKGLRQAWKPGQSGNPSGQRKDGQPKQNRAMAIKRFGEMLLNDQGTPLRKLSGKGDRYTVEELLAAKPYMEGLVIRIKTGAATHIERFVWEHLFGKPVVRIKNETPVTSPLAEAMGEMTPAEIRILAEAARKAIAVRDARALNAAPTPTEEDTIDA